MSYHRQSYVHAIGPMTTDTRARIRDDPAFLIAMRFSLALWIVAYLLAAALLTAQGEAAGGLLYVQLLFQFAGALFIARLMTMAIIACQRTGRLRGWAMQAMALLAATATQGFVDWSSNYLFDVTFVPARFDPSTLQFVHYLRGSFIFFWVYALNFGLVHLALATTRMRDQQRELAEARARAAQAQLAMLRYQLNPHFLFNTLNAISSLVVTRRNDEAEETLARLCTFLRSSLASEPGDFVTLDAELNMVQEYLEIEGVRFGDRLEIDFACEPDAAAVLVPSFLLQPLVENAIKYAVGPSRRPVLIKVEARRDGTDIVITVSDNGDGASGITKGGTGVGLRNIRARLAALYGEAGSLEAVQLEHGFLAIVRLPARTAAATGVAALAEAAE